MSAANMSTRRWWKTPTQMRTTAAGTTNAEFHLDMTGPWHRELYVKVAVLAALRLGWRGYLHNVCLRLWLDEVPDWLEPAKPRGNWKCALCKQHAPPQEVAA